MTEKTNRPAVTRAATAKKAEKSQSVSDFTTPDSMLQQLNRADELARLDVTPKQPALITSLLDAMRRYREAGLDVIPDHLEYKYPFGCKGWETREFSEQELAEKIRTGQYGIGVRNVLGLDFDLKGDPGDSAMFGRWRDLVDSVAPDFVDKLLVEQSKNGGFHVAWKCQATFGNLKLAYRLPTLAELAKNPKSKKTCIIETRGIGGQFMIAPSPGYAVLQGDWTDLQEITSEEQDFLLGCAKSLNRIADVIKNSTNSAARPGDLFNETGGDEAYNLLLRAGWTEFRKTSDAIYLTRPGKTRGVSATYNYVAEDVFYVFSSNASPFEAGKAYSPFAVKTLLEHDGDFSAAAKDLVKRPEIKQRLPAARLDATFPYVAAGGQTLYQKINAEGEITETLVADFTAAITAEIVTEDGRRFFEIEGTTRADGPFSLEIGAEDFSSDLKLRAALVQAAGAQALIYARQSAHLAPAIQKFTSRPAQIKRFDRVGWSGGRFIMPGRADANVRINLPRELSYRVGGDTDQALAAFDFLLRIMPGDQITVLLAFIFQAPLARMMGWRESDRYALFITGQTGQFKTTVAQTAMAIFGASFLNDSGLIRWGEGATQNGLMALAIHATDAPVLIDNYKPSTGGGEQAFYRLLHAILEGGEKTRLTRSAELRESRAIYAWPIFTGEDTPRKDAASLARLLEVKWSDVNVEVLTTVQASAAALPAIGAMWLDWLETPEARQIAQRCKAENSALRLQWAERIRSSEKNAQNIMRVASNLASNELTWLVLQAHPSLGVYARSHKLPELHRAGLDKIASAMAEATVEGLEAVRFLEAIQSLVSSGRCILTPRLQHIAPADPDRHIGWQDQDGFYLDSDLAMQAVNRLLGPAGLGNVSNQKINAQLLALGYIAKTGTDGRVPVTKKCNGKSQRVIHLKKEAICRDSESESD